MYFTRNFGLFLRSPIFGLRETKR